jgi:hypothetical protein
LISQSIFKSNSTTGANVMKLFTSLIYELLYKARVFVPGKPFQLSLLFVNKVKSLP